MTDHRLLVPEGVVAPDLPRAPNSSIDYRDKYRGTLLGGAIGDALGAPVEGWRPDDIRQTFGVVHDHLPTKWPGTEGSVTDDTQMTVCIARSIVERGRVDPEDIAARFVHWLPTGRGVGAACAAAISNATRGVLWYRAGVESAGNGAAMRVAPIGLLHSCRPGALVGDSALTAVITHAHTMAVVSAVAQAYLVAFLVHRPPGTLAVDRLLGSLASAIGTLPDAGARERKPSASPHPVRLADRLREVGDRLGQSPPQAFEYFHNGAFVLESLPAALWCFLRSPEDPEQVIVTAVNGGYDADTVAAMAGSMAGAYQGADVLPTHWRHHLQPREELVELADGLLRLAQSDGG